MNENFVPIHPAIQQHRLGNTALHNLETMPQTVQTPICQLVHALPGRARLRVPLLETHPAIAAQLQPALLNVPGMISVRINGAAKSIIIQYQTNDWIEGTVAAWFAQLLVACI